MTDPRFTSGKLWHFAVLAALCLGSVPAAAVTPIAVEGSFALAGGNEQVTGELTATPASPAPTDLKLDILFHRVQEKNALKRYDEQLTQQMHVIIISDDFSVFLHRNIGHVIDGHGQLRVRFPKNGLYHLYVDAAPRGIGEQVIRFDLSVGDGAASRRVLAPSVTETKTGPYTVELESSSIEAGQVSRVNLHILEHGKPAQDLHPYLGVAAQAVVLKVDDLHYVTVAPAALTTPDSDTAKVSPDVTLEISVPGPGTYQMWLQFDGGRAVYTAPFILLAH